MTGLRIAVFLAFRQLRAKWMLNATAVLGVALGVLTLIAMAGVMSGFQQEFLSQIVRVAPHVRVLAEEPDDDDSLVGRLVEQPAAVELRHGRSSGREVRIAAPSAVAARIEEHPDVVAACPGLEGRTMAAVGTQNVGAVLLGIDPSLQDRCTPLSQFVVKGHWSGLQMGRSVAAIGKGLAESLDITVGDRMRVSTASGGAETLVVQAIIDTHVPALDNVRIYVPLTTAQSVLGRPDIVGHIDVRVVDPLDADRVAAELAPELAYDVESWREANESMLSLFRLQNAVVAFVIVAILLVGGFGILAVQVMLVLQKRRDIAILRAIGLRRTDIVASFLLQGAIIAVLGAVIGDIGGAILLDVLRKLPINSGGSIVESSGFLIYEAPKFYIWGLAFGSLVGTAAGLVPALRASRLEPVDVLRGQIA